MRKIFTLVKNTEIGPMGILLLALIGVTVHVLAFTFDAFSMLRVFYVITFLSIFIALILYWFKHEF